VSRKSLVARLWSRARVDAPLVVLDAVVAVASFMMLLFVRFNGRIPSTYSNRFFDFLPVIVAAQLLANLAWGVYGQIWRHASVAEARRIVFAGATAGAFIFAVNPMSGVPVPRSVALMGALGAAVLMGLVRFTFRLLASTRHADRSATRVVVVGAGEAGAAIVREMQRRPANGRAPVVVVDDDPRKQGRALLGVPVVSGTDQLDRVVEHYGAEEVLVAIPSADQELLHRVMQQAELAGVPLKTLPPVRDLLGPVPTVHDARDLRIEDLLGRTQVSTDVDAIRATVVGRTVLITGAGGSIGSEIAKQVAALRPSRLLLLDHDETHLHDVWQALCDTAAGAAGNGAGGHVGAAGNGAGGHVGAAGNGAGGHVGAAGNGAGGYVVDDDAGGAARVELLLADIRDRERMFDLVVGTRPDVLFHAAAHKHVPLLEAHPAEAVRTNVLGTRNVVDAAVAAGVERLVFISSDKAVRPCNALGYSKWLGEQLVLHASPPGARWCSVRFGNVLGSRGSVIPTFARQIAEGGPVRVTDPRMTRFFMSVQESVQLVLQAATLSDGGEIFMLDMGEPVNILELAERMVRLSGHQVGTEIPIQFVGVRPGEKLSEDLQNPEESASPTAHPSIVRLTPRRIPATMVDGGTRGLADLVAHGDGRDAIEHMAELASGSRVMAHSGEGM
jgi:FlaA1/EpsC-like NDP-sugar epimerase